MNEILQTIHSPMTIYFVRHAQSQHNANKLVAGRMETPLTELGIRQAEETGVYFAKNIEPCAILYSPIGRATHTAQIIHRAHHTANAELHKRIHFEEHPDLVELNAGVFENQSIAIIQKKQPEKYARFIQRSWEAVENAERIESLIHRTRGVWQTIADLSLRGFKTVVGVSHGGFMQWLFKTSLGFTGEHVSAWSPIVRISNCGIFCLELQPTQGSQKQAQHGHAIWSLINHTVYSKTS